MKKITFLTDAIGKGGKERRMLELLKVLCTDANFEVTLISFTDVVEYNYVHELPINFISLKRRFRFDPFAFFRLFSVLKNRKIEIVHSWGSMASVYVLPSIFLLKLRFLNGFIGDAPPVLGSFFNKHLWRARLTFPFSKYVIANSIAGLKGYRVPEKKQVCIYNGIDLERFKNLENITSLKQLYLGSLSGNFIVGMVAAFEERKDYESAIKAASKVQELKLPITFVFIGGGTLFENHKEVALEVLKLRNVIFLGKRDNVESLIQIFDIGILLTNTLKHLEGVSNSILEYMALEKPVIATEGGGTNEVVKDGENGYLIRSYDVDGLVAKILFLSEHPDTRRTMGEKGKKDILSKFSVRENSAKYIDLYRAIDS
jgi:glycosyltransferase involved in cell wall biosynthesis